MPNIKMHTKSKGLEKALYINTPAKKPFAYGQQKNKIKYKDFWRTRRRLSATLAEHCHVDRKQAATNTGENLLYLLQNRQTLNEKDTEKR